MRVRGERHGDVRVSEHLLHDLGMDALTKHESRGGMAKIVETHVLEIGLL